MSLFHIEEKIALKIWDDIVSRPRYKSSVEAEKNPCIRVAAVYSFKESSARCGVNDCLKAHSQGFLVITSDERETNLCETCGQRLMGVAFEEQKKTLRNQARDREQRIRLNTLLQQSDTIKNRVRELKKVPYGASWLYRSLTNFRKTYPTDLLAALRELATRKDGNAILSVLVENNADQARLDQVEQLQGLGIFATDIREALIGNILKPLIQLEEDAENPGSNPSLAAHCRWADNLDDQFACAEHLVKEGRAFFNTENLERLKSIPLSQKSTRRVRSLRWNSDEGIAKGK